MNMSRRNDAERPHASDDNQQLSCEGTTEGLIRECPHHPNAMCEVTPDCDGRMMQGKCTDCGAFPSDDDPASFTGGAGSRTHPLSDEDYRRQRRKLERRAGE